MNKNILPALGAVAAALLASGCLSASNLSRNVPPTAAVDFGAKPVASFEVSNTSYQLFGVVPLMTGTTWKEGAYEESRRGSWELFSDRCSLDENLASVQAAAKEVGTSRVANLVNVEDEESAWSLFLVNRRTIKTSCLFLEPEGE